MKFFILIVTYLNVIFLLMHEFDAFRCNEWKMFRFLRRFKESIQYYIFLYIHIPLIILCIFYLWATFNFNFFPIWLFMNIFSVLHLILHLIAIKWKSNVFENINSFIFIVGYGITGCINLFLIGFY
jgi:hypothetical protein